LGVLRLQPCPRLGEVSIQNWFTPEVNFGLSKKVPRIQKYYDDRDARFNLSCGNEGERAIHAFFPNNYTFLWTRRDVQLLRR
jgi:hypothetical protein